MKFQFSPINVLIQSIFGLAIKCETDGWMFWRRDASVLFYLIQENVNMIILLINDICFINFISLMIQLHSSFENSILQVCSKLSGPK